MHVISKDLNNIFDFSNGYTLKSKGSKTQFILVSQYFIDSVCVKLNDTKIEFLGEVKSL